MALEIGLWRVDSAAPVRVGASGFPLEARLEELIQSDPTILGEPLLVVGRQVPTAFGKFIDLLAVSAEGALHVLELKRDRTPREVVAQVLDYGSWVQGLSHSDVLALFGDQHHTAFEVAFEERFGTRPPEELNGGHTLTVIAADVDPATERIVTYLAGFEVPVNVVFFRYFRDGEREYLARSWLLDEATVAPSGTGRRGGTREPWNGRDWYISFGEEDQGRNWDDAVKYGFVSAGGGAWYSKTLRGLPVGARVFAYIPQAGYVGVGTSTGEARPFDDALVTVGGQQRKLSELPLAGTYRWGPADDMNKAEYVVPVDWISTRPREHAVHKKGLFANQNSACKLRNRFTLTTLYTEFGLDDADADA
jgi:PAS domain-containing protein